MPKTVNQKSIMPTNKLTAAMISAAIAGIVKAIVLTYLPELSDPAIWEPLPYIVGFVVGYVVKDKPNMVTK